ncbi:MAG: gluconokinase [Pseudomonadota bacterium]
MIVVVMGVSGSGKTTIGRLLAARLGCEFVEGDDFHPPANIAKMAAGTPLTDEDRWPWLERLNQELRGRKNAVLACSALKDIYRGRLASGLERVRFVHLHGAFDLIQSRLRARKHLYMPASLLESQFAALEPPSEAIAVDVAETPARCVEIILAALPAGDRATKG